MKKIYILLFTIILFNSCVEDIPVGFLSDNIRMREDTMEVVKGLYVVSGIPMIDGSTQPLKFEILRVKDLNTGKDAPEFFKNYSVKLWKSPYNPDMDSTMELVNKKLYAKEVPPIEINPGSGQIAFNGGTQYIDGELYGVDIKVSNESDSKEYTNYGKIKFVYRPWEDANNFGEWIYGIVASEPGKNYTIENRNPLPPDEKVQVHNNTHPRFHIEKVAERDDVKIKLTFYDCNDNPFPGKAINREPSGSSYRNSWFDNSIETEYLDDGVIFNFPTVPYPIYGRQDPGGGRNSISLSYYQLHPSYYTVTDEAQALADEFAAREGLTFSGINLHVKIVYQINEPGEWHVKVKFRHAKIKK
ncbi:DUF5007 domain-containing protein [Prevotella sp. 10(H)]|uniref:DUF5007 domain-containing protein n=1 Tax=Prevotella sp. 10(H) TaxID=1158294 RepID=UPI0004A77BB9|nr:DUF5007 domain-containing protein [Prevotella sp. 10(H)]